MRKSLPLTILWLLLLQGCASGQRVIVQAVCPAIPPLEQPSALLEPTFSDRMESFLRGKVPEPTHSVFALPNAKLPTVPPAKP